MDRGGVVVFANETARRWLGIAAEETPGEPMRLRPRPGAERFLDTLARVARGELAPERWPAEPGTLRLEGSRPSAEWRALSLDEGLVLAIGRDASALRAAEETLRQSEERWSLAARATRDLLYDWDITRDQIRWGPNAEEVFGVKPADLGTTIAEWVARIHCDDVQSAEYKIADSIARGTTYEDEYRFRRGDGTWALVRDRGLVVNGPDGRAVRMVGSMEDVTARKRAEEELRASEERYRFIAEMTTDVVYEYDPVRHVFTYILAYARRAPLRLAPLDLRSTVSAVVRLLRPTLGPKIAVETETAPDIEPAWADGGQIEQALVNIALNARDAMPKGGRLRFILENLVLDEAAARARPSALPGEYVRVVVEDTGSGMDAEVKKHLFEPFFTTKRDRGSGLGLAVVDGIVRQHQGWVECESEPERGTRFAIHLPRSRVAPSAPPAPAAAPRVLGGTETILLADDEPSIRWTVRTLLEGYGYEVLLAKDGAEAIELFERERQRVDLVILDLTMPRVSGREALESLRAIDPSVRIIVSSGYALDSLPEALPGVAAFLAKPYRPEDLARVVRAALEGRKRAP